MQDFWKVLGKLATDNDFRTEMVNAMVGKTCEPHAKVEHGLVIEEDAIKDIQEKLTKAVGGPVGLFIAAETIRFGVDKDFDTFSSAILDAVAKVATTTPETEKFHVTLGALIVSGDLRVFAKTSGSLPPEYQTTSEADNETLVAIGKDDAFGVAAQDSCDRFWAPGCFVQAAFYPEYLHVSTTFADTSKSLAATAS